MNLLELSLFELNVFQFIKVCVSIGLFIYFFIVTIDLFTSTFIDILSFIYKKIFKKIN